MILNFQTVLILHTCQCQDRFRDDCVLVEGITPSTWRSCCFPLVSHLLENAWGLWCIRLFLASKSKVKGRLCQLVLSFKGNPWAYTLSFVIREAPRGNDPVLCRVWHSVLIYYLTICFNKASVMLKSAVSNRKGFCRAQRSSLRHRRKPASSVLHMHMYFRGQNGANICRGCGPRPSVSRRATPNKTTATATAAEATATTVTCSSVLAGASCRELLPRWNEWCREALCSVSGPEWEERARRACLKGRDTLGTGGSCPRRVPNGRVTGPRSWDLL